MGIPVLSRLEEWREQEALGHSPEDEECNHESRDEPAIVDVLLQNEGFLGRRRRSIFCAVVLRSEGL